MRPLPYCSIPRLVLISLFPFSTTPRYLELTSLLGFNSKTACVSMKEWGLHLRRRGHHDEGLFGVHRMAQLHTPKEQVEDDRMDRIL